MKAHLLKFLVGMFLALPWLLVPAHAQPANDWTRTETELAALHRDAMDEAQIRSRLSAIVAALPENSPYAVQRERARVEIRLAHDATSARQQRQALRTLALANDDAATAELMDVEMIYESHADDRIEDSLRQLDEVRLRIGRNAPEELQNALDNSYTYMYWDVGSFELALRHMLRMQARAAHMPGRDPDRQPGIVNGIAWLQLDMENPEQALTELDRLPKAAYDGSSRRMQLHLIATRGSALAQLGQLQKARQLLMQADASVRAGEGNNGSHRVRQVLAQVLLKTGEPQQALSVAERLRSDAVSDGVAYFVAEADVLRGEALVKTGHVREGLAAMQSAVDFFQGKTQYVALYRALARQVAALQSVGQHEAALQSLQQQHALSMRMFRRNSVLGVASLQVEQEMAQREQRIRQLSAENHLQDERLRSRMWTMIALASVLAAVLVAAVLLALLLRSYRRQRNALWKDALTGAFNRHYLPQWLARHPLSHGAARVVALVDMDHFKAVNDRYGHAAGDAVLRETAVRLSAALSGEAELFRWGGEEFLAVFSEADPERVTRALQRMLDAIEVAPMRLGERDIPVTISIGCANVRATAEDARLASAIAWADAGLYLSKQRGRRQATWIGPAPGHEHERPQSVDELMQRATSGAAWTRTVTASPSSASLDDARHMH